MTDEGGLAVLAGHYQRYLGKALRTGEFRFDAPAPPVVRVLEFPARSEQQVWVYCTAGMSSLALPRDRKATENQNLDRVELMLYSNRQEDELLENLATLAIYPFHVGQRLGYGHTIAGEAGDGIVRTSPLTDLLLTRPYFAPKDLPTIGLPTRNHASLLWVIPIYESERRFAVRNGWDTLEQLFEARRTDTSDLWRAPVA